MRASLALIAAALGLVAASAHDGMHARRMHRVVRRSEAHKHAARACVARASTNSTNSAVKSTKAKASSSKKGKSKSKSKGKGASKGKGKGASNSTTTGSNSTSSGSSNNGGLSLNGVQMGLLPDEGDAGGTKRSMASLNQAIGGKWATYGYYAQAHSGTKFDGGQLLAVKDDVVASGAIFEPAVMPVGGFQGLTQDDQSQAVNICNVMKQFTDAGVETRLRFAHECNFYVTDGTYTGSVNDCKIAFTVVAQQCRKIAPAVKMFLTPNVASQGVSVYQQLMPDDASLVDLCGIDFYPKSIGATTFVDAHKGWHDFCLSKNPKIQYAVGETGLAFAASIDQSLSWVKQIAAGKSQLKALTSMTWFNFQKEQDFLLVAPGNDALNSKTKAALGI